MKIIIAGAGLAGLTLAAALRRSSPATEIAIFERDAASGRGPGYSIGLKGDGAIGVLRRLGLYERIAGKAVTIDSFVFADQRGNALMTLRNGEDEKRLTQRVERVVLRSTLLDAAATPVRFGDAVTGYETTDTSVSVTLADGRVETADWLIGADGVNSGVRAQMIGDAKRYRGLSAIIGDTATDTDHPLLRGGYFMTLGDTGTSIFAYRQRGGVHLSFTSAFPQPGLSFPSAELLERLRTGTLGWHDPIPQLVAALDAERLEFRDYFDRDPAPRLRDGRVWLVGDAAHPMVPFQGQGANVAMRDAEDIAGFIARGATDGAALEAAMLKRGTRAAQESRNSAAQFHTSNRVQRSMRNAGFRAADWMIRRFSKAA